MIQFNTECIRCPDLVKSRRRITWGYGNPLLSTMFIGEAPGYNGCDITGIPFTRDPSGEFFQSMLAEVQWTKEDVYVTNVVKCCPPGNRDPKPEEVENCRIYLQYEITKINPHWIVLMGKFAMQYFFPKFTSIISKWNKYFTLPDYPGIEFFIIPHPAYITRNMKLKEDYIQSFRMIRLLSSPT